MEMNIGQMQPHRPALGDLESLVEVRARAVEVAGHGAPKRTGQKSAGEVILLARAAQIVYSLVQMRAGGGAPRSIDS